MVHRIVNIIYDNACDTVFRASAQEFFLSCFSHIVTLAESEGDVQRAVGEMNEMLCRTSKMKIKIAQEQRFWFVPEIRRIKADVYTYR